MITNVIGNIDPCNAIGGDDLEEYLERRTVFRSNHTGQLTASNDENEENRQDEYVGRRMMTLQVDGGRR